MKQIKELQRLLGKKTMENRVGSPAAAACHGLELPL